MNSEVTIQSSTKLPVLHAYFLNIMICICQNSSIGCRPSAAEEVGIVALSHLLTFLGVEQKYFNGGSVEHWIVTY